MFQLQQQAKVRTRTVVKTLTRYDHLRKAAGSNNYEKT